MAARLLSRYTWARRPFIVGAPMRVMSGPALAVAVSRAGGLGFIGPSVKTQDMRADLEEASKLLRETCCSSSSSSSTSSALPSTDSRLPIGVGFQLWADDINVAIDHIEKFRPCAAWLYAPQEGPGELADWSRRIRSAAPGIQIWVQIGTLGEAKQLLALSELPDVVVVQGAEAGGHGRARDGMGLVTLFPEVADAMAGSHIPLLAAGGIADARGVAAVLGLGAAGAVMGTRFLASHEARVSRGYQDEVVRASDGARSTTRTRLYNHLRGTFGWPPEYSPRTIINRSFVEHQDGVAFEELKKRHDEAQKMGDSGWGPEGRLATYAGASVGLIHEVKGAGEIIREVQQDTLRKIRLLNSEGK
ncbi:inosine monophosphate dehydrogenase [Cryphonectria parasitica EP155]|uniref:Inosine monophosphate dehydrogenase n=1 Tax=Cryphonectria parasitica (strain ATCC 38755 / EP155) TaxID=660469 RepID=A0A9P4XVU0_CRYP1|nr:inosine monophosphate dehydrogenase [Cryphonectria parasitica EP155]KAF3761843.1 inosine monophosphate dehydrogenase [Cryphonectria parasitica EP155]